MKRFFALLIGVVAVSAAADESFVPLSTRSDSPFVTEVTIANRSENDVAIAIEALGPLGPIGTALRLTLAAGETTGIEQADSERVAAIAVQSDGPLAVTAIRRCAACNAMSSVVVVDAHAAIDEGVMTLGNEPMWKRGVGVVNPDAAGALLNVSLHRGDRVIDQTSIYVPGRGALAVSIDDLFTTPGDSVSFSAPQSVLVFGYDANERSGAEFFTAATTPARRRAARSGSPQPSLQTVVLTPSKDNTLYQTSNGSLSNGAGIHLFAGMTNQRDRRRALLAFDVASQVPPGSQIVSVVLKLEVSQTAAGPESMVLHRLSADWGEGSSNAGDSRDGDGASSRTGDATWIHTFFPDRRWSTAGGDFDAAADAAALADFGPVTWGSSAALIARVQDWLDHPSTNFGWIIVGNEASARTTKRFDSREVDPSATRPSLTIEFKK
ncbi:MAG TPA: DNRLRE domain-containing protein [Thermoanaerobaculia bacterium]|jgi:hypothetical protein|nr:DNRLRE domain-containing protein [Thermoanaerobaculia bacterium]